VLQGERELAKDNRSLGQFKLDGIPPASRGVPQIEVTFDIDANGILKVSAKDKATNKEQTVTISGSTSLDKSEINRMVSDAEAHASDDKKRRQEIEVRNAADTAVYQVQRQLNEAGSRLPAHEKSRIEQIIADTKQALKENASIDRIRTLTSDLTQAANAFNANTEPTPHTEGNRTSSGATGSDDVIDAEYTEK
jgi:molecular chaperone DnaK